MHCVNSDSVRRSNPGVSALKHLTAYFDRKTTSHFSFIVRMYSTGDIANIMRDSVSRWGVGTQAGGRLGLRDTSVPVPVQIISTSHSIALNMPS